MINDIIKIKSKLIAKSPKAVSSKLAVSYVTRYDAWDPNQVTVVDYSSLPYSALPPPFIIYT